jgi:hypothetical protein
LNLRFEQAKVENPQASEARNMSMPVRAFIAIATSAAIVDASRATFARRFDGARPASANANLAAACDTKLIATLEPRRVQPPRQSGPYSVAVPFTARLAAPGIAYLIPAKTGATGFVRNSAGFDAAVAFAAGRGRLDMVANPPGPELVAAGISVAPPLGKAGDYYLFDRTGFILVRPSQKTFSSFVIADHEFNFNELRNGWPEFALIPNGTLQIDTLGMSPRRADVIRHERTRIYWILKMGPTLPTFPHNALGRLAIADAPAGEGGIARWIGPTEALAEMAHRGAVVDEQRVELTSIVPLDPPQRSSIDLMQRQNIQCFRKADIDLSALVLPSDFSETSWPGFQNEAGVPKLTPDAAARWRTVPRGE